MRKSFVYLPIKIVKQNNNLFKFPILVYYDSPVFTAIGFEWISTEISAN